MTDLIILIFVALCFILALLAIGLGRIADLLGQIRDNTKKGGAE